MKDPWRIVGPPPQWVEPYLPDFEDLLRVVELTPGFVLMPLEIPGPDLAHALDEWLTFHGHEVEVIAPRSDDDWKDLVRKLRAIEPAPRQVVMVIGSRELGDGASMAFRLLNEHRDSIVAHLACPLFWCGPGSFLDKTGELAPDFWSIRAVDRRLEPKAAIKLVEEARNQRNFNEFLLLAEKRANELMDEGRFAEAEVLIQEALSKRRNNDLLLIAAEIARRTGAHQKALTLLCDKDFYGDNKFIQMGRVFEDQGALAEAESAYEEAFSRGSLFRADTVKAMALLGRLRARTGKPPEAALKLIEDGIAEASRRGDAQLMAFATALLAQATSHLLDQERAKKLARQARELAESAKGSPTALLGGELQEAIQALEPLLQPAVVPPPASVGGSKIAGKEASPPVPSPLPGSPLRSLAIGMVAGLVLALVIVPKLICGAPTHLTDAGTSPVEDASSAKVHPIPLDGSAVDAAPSVASSYLSNPPLPTTSGDPVVDGGAPPASIEFYCFSDNGINYCFRFKVDCWDVAAKAFQECRRRSPGEHCERLLDRDVCKKLQR